MNSACSVRAAPVAAPALHRGLPRLQRSPCPLTSRPGSVSSTVGSVAARAAAGSGGSSAPAVAAAAAAAPAATEALPGEQVAGRYCCVFMPRWCAAMPSVCVATTQLVCAQLTDLRWAALGFDLPACLIASSTCITPPIPPLPCYPLSLQPLTTVLATCEGEREVRPGVYEGYWRWQGHRIRYQRCGDEGPPVLCIHG